MTSSHREPHLYYYYQINCAHFNVPHFTISIDLSMPCVCRDYSLIHVQYRDQEKARLFYHMHETLSTEWRDTSTTSLQKSVSE
jgi:hypothetical protein